MSSVHINFTDLHLHLRQLRLQLHNDYTPSNHPTAISDQVYYTQEKGSFIFVITFSDLRMFLTILLQFQASPLVTESEIFIYIFI